MEKHSRECGKSFIIRASLYLWDCSRIALFIKNNLYCDLDFLGTFILIIDEFVNKFFVFVVKVLMCNDEW